MLTSDLVKEGGTGFEKKKKKKKTPTAVGCKFFFFNALLKKAFFLWTYLRLSSYSMLYNCHLHFAMESARADCTHRERRMIMPTIL